MSCNFNVIAYGEFLVLLGVNFISCGVFFSFAESCGGVMV